MWSFRVFLGVPSSCQNAPSLWKNAVFNRLESKKPLKIRKIPWLESNRTLLGNGL